MKKEEEQQEYERKMAERRLKAYEKSLQPRPGKTPKQIEAEAEARARGAGTGKFAPDRTRPSTAETPEERKRRQQIVRDTKKIEVTIDRFQKERDRLVAHQEARAKTDEWRNRPPHMGLFPDPLTEGIKNIEKSLDYLNQIRGLTANAPLPPELSKFVTEAMGSLNSIKKGEFIPSQVKAFLKKNPGVPPEQAMALYMEWLISQ